MLRASEGPGGGYDSGRITSRTKFNMQYGRLSVSMKVPGAGQGYWPAFWMLGVPWPTGEIDMLEQVNDPTRLLRQPARRPIR